MVRSLLPMATCFTLLRRRRLRQQPKLCDLADLHGDANIDNESLTLLGEHSVVFTANSGRELYVVDLAAGGGQCGYGQGTVSSSGTTVTLSGGTWPADAAKRTLEVGSEIYRINKLHETNEDQIILESAPQ